MRYLLYYVTKQASPWFADTLGPQYLEDNDDTVVVVDLVERKRFWCGEWKPCDVYENGQWMRANTEDK